jgi:hypothetical protein
LFEQLVPRDLTKDFVQGTARALRASPLDQRDDPESPVPPQVFRARAWVAASAKATELGWIV